MELGEKIKELRNKQGLTQEELADRAELSKGFISQLERDMTSPSIATLEDLLQCLGTTLGEALLAPTIIYVKALKAIKENGVTIHGCSHITGGGFYENIPRMLPDGVKAVVKKDSYEVPAIFKLLAEKGDIAEEMMYNTYNMGIGMLLAVDEADVDATMKAIESAGEKCFLVGEVQEGNKTVELI